MVNYSLGTCYYCYYYLLALCALRRELVLVALCAVDVVLLGYEGLGADGVLAHAADEALLVPLPGLVLHLLHAWVKQNPGEVEKSHRIIDIMND